MRAEATVQGVASARPLDKFFSIARAPRVRFLMIILFPQCRWVLCVSSAVGYCIVLFCFIGAQALQFKWGLCRGELRSQANRLRNPRSLFGYVVFNPLFHFLPPIRRSPIERSQSTALKAVALTIIDCVPKRLA